MADQCSQPLLATAELAEPSDRSLSRSKLFKEQMTETERGGTYNEFLDTLMHDASGNPSALWDEALECLKSEARTRDVTERWHWIIKECKEDTQQERGTGHINDILAQLIFLAPHVAGILFDMTMQDLDSGQWYLELTGFFINDPMRCVYSSKNSTHSQNPSLRQLAVHVGWRHPGRSHENAVLNSPSNLNPNVYEITMHRILLPNILDLDILQALSVTTSVEIFAKKSVQAVLYCAWRELMMFSVTTKMVLSFVEIFTLMAWGMTTDGGTLFDRLLWTSTHDSTNETWLKTHAKNPKAWERGPIWDHEYAYDSACPVPMAWNILAALSLKTVLDLACKYRIYWHRRWMAEQWLKKRNYVFGYLRMIWGWKSFGGMLCTHELALFLVRSLLLLFTLDCRNEVMSSTQQAIVSATFIMSVYSLLNTCRAVACKVSLSRMALSKAIGDPEVTHFVCLVTGLFVIFITSWEIVDRQSTVLAAMVMSFRGLVIGDGDGLDFLGEKVDDTTSENEEAHKYKAVMGVLACVLFFSYLMNLLIAIFGNTYDNARKEVVLHFQQLRVRMLRDSILASHKFSLLPKWCVTHPHKLLMFSICLCVGGAFLSLVPGGLVQLFFNSSVRSIIAGAFLIFSTLTMAVGAALLEAYPFVKVMDGNTDDDWFPWDDNWEKDHYLYIWCRADYNEHVFLGTKEFELKFQTATTLISELGSKIDAVDERMDARMNAIEAKLDWLISQHRS